MTKENLATFLNNREYPFDMSDAERKLAKDSGLVVVYGASDDLMEFDGAIHYEIGAYEGTIARLDKEGLFSSWDDLNH